MKPAVYDWLISLGLHAGLIGSALLLTQVSPDLAAIQKIDEPIRWVSVEAVAEENSETPAPANAENKTAVDTTPQPNKAANLSAKENPAKTTAVQPQPTVKYVEKIQAKTVKTTTAKPDDTKPIETPKTTQKVVAKKPVQLAKAVEKTATQPIADPKSVKDNKAIAAKMEKPNKTQPVTPSPTIKSPAIANAPPVEVPVVQKTVTAEKPSKSEIKANGIDKLDTKITTPTTTAKATVSPMTNVQTTPQNEAKVNDKTSQNTRQSSVSKPTAKPADNTTQWKAQFVATVNRHKIYPSNARKTSTEGSVLLAVHVMANGDIHCCDIKQSSGSSLLDKAALQAANKAVNQTRGKLPTNQSFGFDFYVDYVLND